MVRAEPGALLATGLTPLPWQNGFILLTGFLREEELDPVGESLIMALLDSVGVNLLVGVSDNLPPRVDGLFPVLGSEAEDSLGVPATLSVGIDLML